MLWVMIRLGLVKVVIWDGLIDLLMIIVLLILVSCVILVGIGIDGCLSLLKGILMLIILFVNV